MKDKAMLLLFFILLLTIGIGYASLSTELDQEGTVNIIGNTWNVYMHTILVDENSTVSATSGPTISGTTLNYSVTLSNPGDQYDFYVYVTNTGTLDAMVNSVTINGANSGNVTSSVTYWDDTPISANDKLAKNSTKILKVHTTYTGTSSSSTPLTISVSVPYRIATSGASEPSIAALTPSSFANDSWLVILTSINNNNTSAYNVGDTKTIKMGTFGNQTIRIANKTACTTEVSQSACGFVLEFTGSITNHNMNSSNNNTGGWPESAMRSYLNSTVYNAMPEIVRSAIIDTTVVTGWPSGGEATPNYSTDKLYLLAPQEVYSNWSASVSNNRDAAPTVSRQLDYYANNNTTTNTTLRKGNGAWWFRTPDATSTRNFLRVSRMGSWGQTNATSSSGTSPAFRLQ